MASFLGEKDMEESSGGSNIPCAYNDRQGKQNNIQNKILEFTGHLRNKLLIINYSKCVEMMKAATASKR